MTRTAAFVRIVIAYVLAIGVGLIWLIWGPGTGMRWLDSLIADVLATLVIFGFSRLHHNSSFYDAYWSVIPPLLVIWWWVRGDTGIGAWHCWAIVGVVTIWAVRLTINWIRTFPGLHHEDWRYPMLRGRAGRAEFVVDLTAIHLVPTLQVFVALMPVYVAVWEPDVRLPWLVVVATVVGLGAVALETLADRQLRVFTADAEPGAVMDRGVWSWSRHPNYFGEFGFWFSLALFGIAAVPGDAWWMFVGAVVMLAMFLGASIPMMEQRSLERRPAYAEVMARVSMFVPRPPRPARVAGR
ncbi:DUF1295 domain-containing protein [Gordonia sp. NPDC003950]